jgi:hypothetical protein
MSKVLNYFINIGEIISQAGNAIFLAGNPNMTISARCYLARNHPKWGWCYKVVNKIFFWQEDHCRSSWVSDIVFARKALFELENPRRPDTDIGVEQY